MIITHRAIYFMKVYVHIYVNDENGNNLQNTTYEYYLIIRDKHVIICEVNIVHVIKEAISMNALIM